MKWGQYLSTLLLLVGLGFANQCLSQDIESVIEPLTDASDLSYEVERVFVPLSISRDQLHCANTVAELNEYFKEEWVKEYVEVKITATNNGHLKTATSANETLTLAQKDILEQTDYGSNISVNVRYLPDNNLVHNDVKEESFSFFVYADTPATYIDGYDKLKNYLKVNAVDRIEEGIITGYGMAAVKFTVNEKGKVVNPHIFESSKDDKTDALLLDVISKMGSWNPAEYRCGSKVDQEFVFSVGHSQSCVINLLGVRREQ